MLDFLFTGTTGDSLSVASTLAVTGTALGLGVIISLTYCLTHRNRPWGRGYVISLIMLPAIIAVIILLIGNNVARAFSLAGAFSLIRFRSAPGDPKDIAYVFFTLGVGLACGMGYLGYGILVAVVLCAAMFLLELFKFGCKGETAQLRIQIPENMDYEGAFDSILKTYAQSWRPLRVRTTEFGALFELTYELTLRDTGKSKELLDALRCKNGNLTVSLNLAPTENLM